MAQNGSSSPINSVVSTLTIMSVVLTDAGNYTCRMRGDNSAELMGTAQLIVTLSPSVTPTPVIVTPTLCMCIHNYIQYNFIRNHVIFLHILAVKIPAMSSIIALSISSTMITSVNPPADSGNGNTLTFVYGLC